VRFQPTPTTTIDLVAFETLAAKGDVDALTQAVALYRGDFMAGLTIENCPEFELWLLQEREFWRKQVIHLLQQLMTAHSAAEHYFQAQQVADRLLALEPWHEETHRQLMRFLALRGDRNAALRQYESCRQLLAQELAVDPMPETTALYEQIRNDKVTRWQGDNMIKPFACGRWQAVRCA
jgi:DNA-binding SARP family transcriptional activator